MIMKKDKEGHIVLTKKEAEKVADLLYTLAAMAGAYDQDFTRDCKKAEKIADKITEFYIE